MKLCPVKYCAISLTGQCLFTFDYELGLLMLYDSLRENNSEMIVMCRALLAPIFHVLGQPKYMELDFCDRMMRLVSTGSEQIPQQQ